MPKKAVKRAAKVAGPEILEESQATNAMDQERDVEVTTKIQQKMDSLQANTTIGISAAEVVDLIAWLGEIKAAIDTSNE